MNYLILDDNGVIWSSGDSDAFEVGQKIMDGVENGTSKRLIKQELGDSWNGDLVFCQEISRTR